MLNQTKNLPFPNHFQITSIVKLGEPPGQKLSVAYQYQYHMLDVSDELRCKVSVAVGDKWL